MELDDAAAIGLTEMMYSKRQQQCADAFAKSLSFGGQVLPLSSSMDPADHIKVSCFYEIDHSKLPPKSRTEQLNLIRVVMVNEKTRMRVSLRFPSIYTLRAYFDECNSNRRDGKMMPAFDEKYIMGSEVAAEVLYRRIPPHELAEKRKLWRFWAAPSVPPREVFRSPPSYRSRSVFVSKRVSLMSELNSSGMIKWGQRRQVRFLARHVEDKRAMTIKDDEEEDPSEGQEEKGSSGDEEEEEEEEDVKLCETQKNCKRKRPELSCRTLIKRREMPKREKKCQIVVSKRKKHKVLKNSIDRWSAERYKLAEVNMLKIMKEKGAAFGNPILRPELRSEARKLIGDTGLLDHLLKHMAGRVAPGGEERFRRRHNAEGAMEYWLEKANLIEMRKEAGVQDPYWIPPPGWKPGDNPTQDPICSREIRNLKEEIAQIKKDMEKLKSKKNQEDLAIVTTPISSDVSQNMEHDVSLIPMKEMYVDLVNKKAKIEEQLMKVSQSLSMMQKGMEKQTTVEESGRTDSLQTSTILQGSQGSTPATGTERERKLPQKKLQATFSGESEQAHCNGGGSNYNMLLQTDKPRAQPEDKAAKIERLKSGFTLYKPQGNFLWPDMTENFIGVPTPPSVSSKSVPLPHILSASPSHRQRPLHASTVKPLAEIRPLTVTSSSTVSTPKTPLINLNELPSYQNENGIFGSHPHSSYTVTYHRRHQQIVAATTSGQCMVQANTEMSQWEGDEQRKEMIMYCEQKQEAASLQLHFSEWE